MKAATSLVESQGIISVTEILIASAVFCLTFMVIRSFQQRIPKGLKRLPGPRGYPLIGNMLELGRNPHLTLTQMSQKYGDVMQIRIGTKPVLVLSGLDTIRQALVKQGEDFMGRPDLYSFRYIGDGQSLTFSTDSGEVWRARRKLAQNALKAFSVSPSPNTSSTCLLEEHVSKEADYLVTKLLPLMEEEKRFDPYRYVVVSVANVICAMCFGRRYNHDDQEFLSIVNVTDEFIEVAASGNPADFIPVLQYLPSRAMKKFVEFNTKFLRLLQNIVKEHYKSFEKDNIRDITDSLIEQSQENKMEANANVQLPKEKIVNLVNDLFGAGFDTVTTALSWSLMYLVKYPDIQKKIQEELDQTIGRERRPRLSDRPMLPYIEAFILEMFRHSSFLPFTIPHCTTKDTVLNGYFIPKDLCVFVNQWQVNHDEKLWKEPSTFDPERFLSASGTEIKKADAEKVLVFGLGKRRCIGEIIARWEVFLFLAILLQRLEFSVSDGEKLDMRSLYGLTMKHKRCEHFQAKQRFPIQSSEQPKVEAVGTTHALRVIHGLKTFAKLESKPVPNVMMPFIQKKAGLFKGGIKDFNIPRPAENRQFKDFVYMDELSGFLDVFDFLQRAPETGAALANSGEVFKIIQQMLPHLLFCLTHGCLGPTDHTDLSWYSFQQTCYWSRCCVGCT